MRQSVRPQLYLLLSLLFATSCTDFLTSASSRKGAAVAVAGSEPTAIETAPLDCALQPPDRGELCDPNADGLIDDGFEMTYLGDADALTESTQQYADEGQGTASTCPLVWTGSSLIQTPVRLPDGSTERFTVNVAGKFYFVPTSLQFPRANYQFPSGFFPTLGSSGVSISIRSGDGLCTYLGLNFWDIHWYRAYGIEGQFPRRYRTTGGSGTPGDGVLTCTWEYAYLERDRGFGWEVIWEGWVKVCS